MNTPHPIKVKVEIQDLPSETTAALNRLIERLNDSGVACDLGRELVAQMAREEGFWCYIGGWHVAVHSAPGTARIAILTSTSADWR